MTARSLTLLDLPPVMEALEARFLLSAGAVVAAVDAQPEDPWYAKIFTAAAKVKGLVEAAVQSGSIGSAGEFDVYNFTAKRDGTYVIDVDLPGSNLDSYVLVIGPDWVTRAESTPIASDDDPGFGDEFSQYESAVTISIQAGQTCRIVVCNALVGGLEGSPSAQDISDYRDQYADWNTSDDGPKPTLTGSYKLTVESEEMIESQRLPGAFQDAAGRAKVILPGKPQGGGIDRYDGFDVYKFTASQDGRYYVDVDCPHSNLDTAILVFDGEDWQRSLDSSEDTSGWGAEYSQLESAVTLNLAAGQTVYIVVTNTLLYNLQELPTSLNADTFAADHTAWDTAEDGPKPSLTGTYSLSIATEEMVETPRALQHASAQAKPILPDTPARGRIDDYSGFVVYEFTATQSGSIDIDVDCPHSSLDSYLMVYAKDGWNNGANASDDDAGTGEEYSDLESALTLQVTAGHTYYIVVTNSLVGGSDMLPTSRDADAFDAGYADWDTSADGPRPALTGAFTLTVSETPVAEPDPADDGQGDWSTDEEDTPAPADDGQADSPAGDGSPAPTDDGQGNWWAEHGQHDSHGYPDEGIIIWAPAYPVRLVGAGQYVPGFGVAGKIHGGIFEQLFAEAPTDPTFTHDTLAHYSLPATDGQVDVAAYSALIADGDSVTAYTVWDTEVRCDDDGTVNIDATMFTYLRVSSADGQDQIYGWDADQGKLVTLADGGQATEYVFGSFRIQAYYATGYGDLCTCDHMVEGDACPAYYTAYSMFGSSESNQVQDVAAGQEHGGAVTAEPVAKTDSGEGIATTDADDVLPRPLPSATKAAGQAVSLSAAAESPAPAPTNAALNAIPAELSALVAASPLPDAQAKRSDASHDEAAAFEAAQPAAATLDVLAVDILATLRPIL